MNPHASNSTVEVIIYEKHLWTLSRLRCNRTLIASLGWYTDGGRAFTRQPFIQCQSSPASCSGTRFTTISQRTNCTDFSTSAQISSGALIQKLNLSHTTNIVVGYYGAAWPVQILMTNGAPANYWSIVTHIDLTQGYPINSSPGTVLFHHSRKSYLCPITVTGSLSIHRVREGQLAVIQIPYADWDQTDSLGCRWANNVGAAGDECGDVCNSLPCANLSGSG